MSNIISEQRKLLLLLLSALLFCLVSCSTSTATLTKPKELEPSSTPTFTSTNTPTSTSTPTVTYTPTPTLNTPTPYVYSTAVPVDEDDGYILDLNEMGYTQIFNTSTLGADGYTYSVYMYVDSSFYERNGRWYRKDDGCRNTTEGCRIVFYRSDEGGNEFVDSFGAPISPEEFPYDEYPNSCFAVDWDRKFPSSEFGIADKLEHTLLRLNGYWSDINHNGFPEFAIYYYYCSGSVHCWGDTFSFYEIRGPDEVVNITADLPGIISPPRVLHSISPLELYVYEREFGWCSKEHICSIDTWWIYRWDEDKFIDVSSEYKDEYIAEMEKRFPADFDNYGDYYKEHKYLWILFHYEKVGLREQAVDKFLEVTDPSHWPDLDTADKCWLQFRRALAVEDLKQQRPFTTENQMIEIPWEPGPFRGYFNLLANLSEYDLSACEELEKEYGYESDQSLLVPTITATQTITPTSNYSITPSTIDNCDKSKVLAKLKSNVPYDEFEMTYEIDKYGNGSLIIWVVDPLLNQNATELEIGQNIKLAKHNSFDLATHIANTDECTQKIIETIRTIFVDSNYVSWLSQGYSVNPGPVLMTELESFLRNTNPPIISTTTDETCTWNEARENISRHFGYLGGYHPENFGFFYIIDDQTTSVFAHWVDDVSSDEIGADGINGYGAINVALELTCLNPEPDIIYFTVVDKDQRLLFYGYHEGELQDKEYVIDNFFYNFRYSYHGLEP